MSGICGIISFDGKTRSLDPILKKLERRGPDGTRNWAHESVVLGHTLLGTTPEALVEVLPFTQDGGGCTITADARLDNREELLGELHFDGETRVIGDGELILRAFAKWGEECPTHLLGDFAFAIWNPRTERLFCARDHMGMRQLIYHYAPGKLFAFATEADALIAHPDVPKQINQARIADYLDDLEGLDFTSTFFENVYRLPPAHVLTIDRSGMSLRCYWELNHGSELKLETDQEYADAFLEVFTKAVHCRLRSPGPLGSMLSGGLDSNSIAAVAAAKLAFEGRGPLPTLSAIDSQQEDCAESNAIKIAIRSPLCAPTLVHRRNFIDSSGEILRMMQHSAEPFDAHMVVINCVYGAAKQLGLNVVLDGAGADVVLTSGNYVAVLLKQGKLRAAVREASLQATFWRPFWPFWKIILSSSYAVFAPQWVRRLRWAANRQIDEWATQLGRKNVSSDFAQMVNLGGRRKQFRDHLWEGRPADAGFRVQSIRHPHLVAARERYDRVAAAYGIEPRDPFMDIRLIQFALSLPSSQLQADGWPKVVLRRAMAGQIPTQVAWRRGKTHLGWAFATDLIDHWISMPMEQVNLERVMSMLGSHTARQIRLGKNKAAWLKLMILQSWLARTD